jgi:Acetyltransferase (GNAT) family.
MKIEEVNLTKEILHEIKKLDDLFYGEDEFGIDWYLSKYTDRNKGFVLFNDDSEIVGYGIPAPIKKEYYDALYNGVIISDLYVNSNMYLESSDYYYISSMVIKEEYRNLGFGERLAKLMIADGKKNVALTVSKKGAHIISKYMKHHLKVNDFTNIFINK